MPSIPIKKAARNVDSIQTAKFWLSLGVLPVPIRPRSKQPAGGEGWNTLRVTEDTIPHYFSPGQNIGGLWGEPSNWVIDVDLDWDEAVVAAKVLLPVTFTYGRWSRPKSHYLYRCEGISGRKWRTDKEVIVELRSTGAQSVLPPSIHPDNERYQIDREGPFLPITPKTLEAALGRVAAAALLARRYPDEGGRHDFIHTVTGTLLHRGWEDALVKKFMRAVLKAVGDRENDLPQRDRTVVNTIRMFREGARVAGLTTLTQWLNGKDFEAIRNWVDPRGIPRVSIIETDTSDAPDRREERVVPPDSILRIDGLVGEVAQWAAKRSFSLQPLFDIAVGLTTVATASLNKYVVEGWNTPLQPYCLLLAPTASGKESALDSVSTGIAPDGDAECIVPRVPKLPRNARSAIGAAAYSDVALGRSGPQTEDGNAKLGRSGLPNHHPPARALR